MKFSLVIEFNRPAAVLIPWSNGIRRTGPVVPTQAQFHTLYSLLPENSSLDADLANRWGVALVLCHRDWADQQRHRVPMLPPKNAVPLEFAFL